MRNSVKHLISDFSSIRRVEKLNHVGELSEWEREMSKFRTRWDNKKIRILWTAKEKKKESKQSEIAHRTGHNNDKNFFGRTQMISENVRHSSVQFFFLFFRRMLQRKLRTQNSIKFDVTEFFVIYFFFCVLPPTNVVDENSDIPDQKNDDIVQWPKVPPFLSFSFCARWASCMMRWHARDVRRKRHHFAFDAYTFRFFRSSEAYIPIVILSTRLAPNSTSHALSDERWNSQYRKMFAGAKSAQCLFLIQPNRLCQFN